MRQSRAKDMMRYENTSSIFYSFTTQKSRSRQIFDDPSWRYRNMFEQREKGGSPGLVVMGGDSWSEGRGFKSQLHILDGHFFTYICCKNCNDACLERPKINEKEAGVGPFFYKNKQISFLHDDLFHAFHITHFTVSIPSFSLSLSLLLLTYSIFYFYPISGFVFLLLYLSTTKQQYNAIGSKLS